MFGWLKKKTPRPAEAPAAAPSVRPPTTQRYPSGKPWQQGELRAGQKHGLWTTWLDSGEVAGRASYLAGRRQGAAILYHPNGRVAAQLTFRAGQLHGPCTFFYPDSRPRFTGQVEYGLREGHWVFHRPTGAQAGEGDYQADQPVGWESPDHATLRALLDDAARE